MSNINDENLEKSIDLIESMSDDAYEGLIDNFEKDQEHLSSFLNERLEDLADEDQRSDVITIMMIIYHSFKEDHELAKVSPKVLDECEAENLSILEEIQGIAKTSELLDDEDLSLSYIKNKAIHGFVQATLDPNEDDSPFDGEMSDNAYHIIKTCVDALEVITEN